MNAAEIAARHNAQLNPAAAKPGHNSASAPVGEYVDRLVNLEEEKKAIADDIRELKAEAKNKGLNPKALAAIVREKRETPEKKEARKALDDAIDSYRLILKMLD